MNEELTEFIPLVTFIAKNIARRLPKSVRMNDLIQEGWIGLLAAKKGFDPNKQVPFAAYANLRIRGAILDSLRKSDWVKRTVRQQANRTGILPTTYITQEEINFDNLPSVHEDQLARCIRCQKLECLEEVLNQLDPRTVLVVKLYFFEGLTQRQIASIVGIVPSRVCQILATAVKKIRCKLERVEI